MEDLSMPEIQLTIRDKHGTQLYQQPSHIFISDLKVVLNLTNFFKRRQPKKLVDFIFHVYGEVEKGHIDKVIVATPWNYFHTQDENARRLSH